MIRAIIIEDDLASIQLLRDELNYYKDIQIVGVAKTLKESLSLLIKEDYDLVFADIQLKDGTIFDVLRQIENFDAEIIFITAYNEFIINALRLSALDYLLKPFEKNEFEEAIQRYYKKIFSKKQNIQVNTFLQQVQQNELSKIVLKEKNEYYIIDINDIYYIKSDGCYSTFYTINNNEFITTKPIGYYEELLKNHSFLRIHHSYIVNLAMIETVFRQDLLYVKLKNGKILPVTRFKKNDLLKFFLK